MGAGRPKKKIDKTEFEKLCALQCTLEEIAGFFDCCGDTIESWCKRTYKCNFSDVQKTKRQSGKISLRRIQFEQAEKSVPMAIWLGKQYLGQADVIAPTEETDSDGFIEALSGSASEDWADDDDII